MSKTSTLPTTKNQIEEDPDEHCLQKIKKIANMTVIVSLSFDEDSD